MSYVLVVAGASIQTFDLVSKISGSLLAPQGEVVRFPLKGSDAVYTATYVRLLVEATAKCLLRSSEHEPVSVLLLYLNASNGSEQLLLDAFFPMALPLAVDLLEQSGSGQLIKGKVIERLIVEGAQKLRQVYPQVSDRTRVSNLSPLLLPLRNFRSDALALMLRELYDELGRHEAPGNLLKEKVDRFKAIHPPTKPPDGSQNCYTDGHLFFKSPGRHRHGFFRNSGKNVHSDDCILRARSRLGGSIPYTMHYDCTPQRKLAKAYPNCHCEATPPKDTHVNIGPSDFII